MNSKLLLIIVILTVLSYWYYQTTIDTNENYMVPYNILNKKSKCFSLKSIKLKKNFLSKFRYTIGINKNDFEDDEWDKKIKSIIKELDISKSFKKEILEKVKDAKSISIGSKIDNQIIYYKLHIWYDLDKEISKSGIKYEWNSDDKNPQILVKDYSCETDISADKINKQIIKYSTYDINLYNTILALISDIFASPLREEVSNPVILYSTNNDGINSINIRLDDYNVKIKQIEEHLLKIGKYLDKKKDLEKWIKEENDMMLASISFGFDYDKKFYFSIHNYTIH